MRPYVSVIIPTRNRETGLRRAVQSILAQTWQDFEAIIVDDGSSDGTPQYLEHLSSAESRIRVLNNTQPSGGAAARNFGIGAARGKWIAFLDDDDEWLPGKLTAQLATLAANPDAVACSTWYIRKCWWNARKQVRVPTIGCLDDLFRGNTMGGASMCICDAQTLRRIGGYDITFRSGQDWDLWTRLSQVGAIVTCAEATVIYNDYRGMRISTNWSAQYQGGRCYYFKYRALMSPEIRIHRLAHQCYVMSRQRERGIQRRLKFLWISLRAADWSVAILYARRSLPRVARDALLSTD